MGLCCSNEESVNSHCTKLPVVADQEKLAVSPNGTSRLELHPDAQLPPAAAAAEKLLLGVLVEEDGRCWPPDGRETPDAHQMKKMMAEIDVFGFKIIAKSCSHAAKGAAAVGGTETSMHVQLRNDNDKLEIANKRKESVISVNQTGRAEESPNDAMKMDWVSVLSSGQLKDSYKDSSSVVRKVANQLESIRSPIKNGVGRKESSPVQDRTSAAAKIQAEIYEKKGPMSSKDATQKANSFSTEPEGEEISIFSAEKYFTEEEPTVTAGRSDELTNYTEKTTTSSGFCFHIGKVQQCRPRHPAKSDCTTDLEFPSSTASEADICVSNMEDGNSLANFKKSNLQKTGSQQETNSNLSSESSPLKKKLEEACLFGSEQRFEEGQKERLGKTQLPSSKVQWHLAQVNSHEFVMSPRLQFSDSLVSPSSSKELDQTICEMKQEANKEHGSQALEDLRAFEVALDEFSFDSLSSSSEISPQGMQKTAAARDPAVRYGESYRGSGFEYAKSSWTSPVHAHEQNDENAPFSSQAAISVKTKFSSPFASPDLLIENKKGCYHVPSLNRSFSDLRELKGYQLPGHYPKMHGRNESDDYQSDMSADLFEIDRLEAPSSVSSPPTPPRISVWEPTTPALAML